MPGKVGTKPVRRQPPVMATIRDADADAGPVLKQDVPVMGPLALPTSYGDAA